MKNLKRQIGCMFKMAIFSLFVLTSCTVNKTNDKVIYLQNNSLKIGILPDVGGRMVFFGEPNGENLLFSDSSLWNEPEQNRVVVSPDANFKAYNGLITWVGPQSAWWSQQEIRKEKKGDLWPPDPYLIYANYQVVEQNDTLIVLLGAESPVSGLQLTKKFVLYDIGLQISVSAKNITPNSLSWDLWSNARFNAFSEFKIPTDSSGILKIQYQDEEISEPIEHRLKDGFFTFEPEKPIDSKKRKIAKAFIYPTEATIMLYKNNLMLTIAFDKVPFDQIHPEQALIEVYNCVSSNGLDDILELEHHSAYKTLKAGETMYLSEYWTISLVE